MTAPDGKAVARLGKLLPLLASPHDGERAAAALLATRHLAALGLDWQGLVQRAFARAPDPLPLEAPLPMEAVALVRGLFGAWGSLTQRERSFLRATAFSDLPVSDADLSKLRRMAERVRGQHEDASP